MTELDYLESIEQMIADVYDYVEIFVDEYVPLFVLLAFAIIGIKTLFEVLR